MYKDRGERTISSSYVLVCNVRKVENRHVSLIPCVVSDCACAASGRRWGGKWVGWLFSVGLGSRGRVGLKTDHFRFGENFPSDFWGIVSDFRVGDWVLFCVKVKNQSLPVWGFSEGFRRLSKGFPMLFEDFWGISDDLPEMFRRFPEGCPTMSRRVPEGFWEGGAYSGFSGKTSVWLV